MDNNVNTYEPECILGVTYSDNNNSETLSIEDINVNELEKQKDTLHGDVTDERIECNDLLLEHSLYGGIINQSEMNIDNDFNLDCNINPSITFSFEELNDLQLSNIVSSYENIEENSINNNNNDNNVPDKCYSITDSDNIKNRDMDNRDNGDNINRVNVFDGTESYGDINKNAEQLRKAHSYVDYSAYNSDDNSDDTDNSNDKDPDYCYNEDSENSDEENDTLVQERLTESNNTTQTSLETSVNVSGQKICDDVNLRVECSKPKGIGKQNFCYYCKKMQSKISRHLERVHKNEEEVKKFTLLPKGTENMYYISLKKRIFLR